MQTTSSDIIIVGGGMVGLALACMLAERTALSVVVLEAQTNAIAWSPSQYHHRVSAIALSSQRIFQSLGIWDAICAQRVSPFSQIQVWDAAGKAEISFDSREIAQALLGYIVENNVLQLALLEKIKSYPNIQLITGVKLTHFQDDENGVTITTDGRQFKASLAVGADGSASWLRTQAGIAIEHHDYQQQAIVATVETSLPHKQIARQVFLPSGPLAFLPLLPENTTSIVWSLPTDQAQELLALNDEAFRLALSQAYDCELGELVSVSKRFMFPLIRQQAKHYVKSHVVLVGDAAHSMHPLAGQGVNIGLLDAASLAEILLSQQNSLADKAALRRYERWRKADNLTLLAGVDKIKQLFASDKKSIHCLRSLGLKATNRLQGLKNIFIQHAVGDREGLPKLARNRHQKI